MTDAPKQPEAHASSHSAHFAGAAFVITWLVTAWRLGPGGTWIGDYASLQGLASGVVGFEGLVSQGVATLLRLTPLGTLVQRVGLANALGAAFIAWFACSLAFQALHRGTTSERFACWLALGASLIVALGTTVQRIATVTGGSSVAAALGLACVWLMVRLSEKSANAPIDPTVAITRRDCFLLGGVVAITWLESHVVGLLTTGTGVTLWALSRRNRSSSVQLSALGGFGAVASCIFLPCFLARRGLLASSVERPLLNSLQHLDPFSHFTSRLGAWPTELGPIWLCVSLAGLVILVLRVDRRRNAWVLTTLGVASILLPSDDAPVGHYGYAVVVIGTAMLSVSASIACRDIVCWATIRKPNSFALGATLVVLLLAVTVLARNEDIGFATNRYRSLSGEAWTDEALVVLPARAIVLTRTPSLTNRLVAAQVAEGVRPDVLVVPIERATDPYMVGALLAAEPALAPTLRELAINGKPSENALAGLADARPLYVEFDGSWDPRLREHLLVQPIIHRVFSQTLGRSDRAAALPAGQRAVARLIAATEGGASSTAFTNGRDPGDVLTRTIVDLRLREQMTLLLALGDRQGFEAVCADYDRAYPGSQWMSRLRRRVGSSTRGAVLAFDLLPPAASVDPVPL